MIVITNTLSIKHHHNQYHFHNHHDNYNHHDHHHDRDSQTSIINQPMLSFLT